MGADVLGNTVAGACYASSVSSRSWQVVAFVISVAILIGVIAKYGLRSPDRPRDPDGSQPHVGMEHFGSNKPAHEGGTLAPLQVFATAKVGDWLSYRVITESSIAPTITTTVIERISSVDDRNVTRSFAGRIDATGEVRSDRTESRPRNGLTLDQLIGNDIGGWTITELVVADDVHEVGGRSFPCKKISFASRDPLLPNKRTHTDLWISSEVPAGSLVEQREVQELRDMRFTITKQLIGFGDATTTRWGKKPEGL